MLYDLCDLIFAGMKISASSAAEEFSRGAGSSALAWIKKLIIEKYNVKILESASSHIDDKELKEKVRSDIIEKVVSDVELKAQVKELVNAINALPDNILKKYEIEHIEMGTISRSEMDIESESGVELDCNGIYDTKIKVKSKDKTIVKVDTALKKKHKS
jgi:hypothetical protein